MNSRRNFFKSLALIGAGAAAAPGIFIPRFEPVKWKVLRPRQTAILHNRAYRTAEFEVFFYNMPMICDPEIFGDCEPRMRTEPGAKGHVVRRSTLAEHHHNWEPWPLRFNEYGADGKPIFIPPFWEVELV